MCKLCHYACYLCFGPGENECSKCRTYNGLVYYLSYDHVCSATCPGGYYPDATAGLDSTGKCLGCGNNCKTCRVPTTSL